MGALAIYQVAASRDIRQDDVKLAMKALGLNVGEGKDEVMRGAIVYTQRDYNDFTSILGDVDLRLTTGRLREGAAKECTQSRAREVQAEQKDTSDGEGEKEEE